MTVGRRGLDGLICGVFFAGTVSNFFYPARHCCQDLCDCRIGGGPECLGGGMGGVWGWEGESLGVVDGACFITYDLWLLPMERSTHCILKCLILLLRIAMRLLILMLGGCGCLSIADKPYDGTSNSQER
jgi:hypothetical protein